jgi:hypothetical protein
MDKSLAQLWVGLMKVNENVIGIDFTNTLVFVIGSRYCGIDNN